MDEEDQYDEFGNPIGNLNNYSDTESSSSSDGSDSEVNDVDSDTENTSTNPLNEIDEEEVEQAEIQTDDIVLYKDTMDENNVEILVETNNTQSLNEPLIKSQTYKARGKEYSSFPSKKKDIPRTSYDKQYMFELLKLPERIRNVAVIGPLHSGKTSLVDLFVQDAHDKLPHMSNNIKQGWTALRYMDSFKQEIERGISIKLNGLTFMETDLNDKSMVYNILDTPGHVNFIDECAVALEAVEIAIICLDVVEGVTSVVRKLIEICEKMGKPFILLINKIDRLIFELKIPPMDAYLKIKHIVEEINMLTTEKYSPELDNIIFASTKLGFTFTVREFVKYYYSRSIPNDKIELFIKKSYGCITLNKGKYEKITDPVLQLPTFHDLFILPLYKLLSSSIALDKKSLDGFVSTLQNQFNIVIENPQDLLKMDPYPLLRYICKLVFHEKQAGLYHCINEAGQKGSSRYTESSGGILARVLKTLDYGGEEYSLVKVLSGTLVANSNVQIIDSNNEVTESDNLYNDDDNEDDPRNVKITEIALMEGRYIISVESAGPGQIVLVKNISQYFDKSATLYSNIKRTELPIFGPINYINKACFKVIIEPLVPKELPKLLDALVKVSKYYPGLVTKIEESGEHIILGFGELYLDCLLYDLRNTYAHIEIKISNPVTIFSEGVHKESFTAIPVESSNKNISLSVSAKPLDYKLLNDLSQNKKSEIDIENDIATGNIRKISKMLRTEYDWDSLTSRNVWTFHYSNILVDDTLPDETDKELLMKYQQQIKQGFYWAVKEGPLCEEYMYGIQFNLLNFQIKDVEQVKNIGSQLIPMVRKACYIAMMTAEPIILEPIYEISIIIKTQLIPIAEELFCKRRGAKILTSRKIGGSPLSELVGRIPVIESIGMETDLRLSTRGGAQCQLQFWNNNWRRVPGDVLDEDAIIPKLKPAPYESLSRDFVMKTRRRKGLSNDGFMSNDGPSLSKYIDPELFEQLKLNNLV
ncbi:similar to Saccharomyces cerevisiae YKL173W SNU114 GTPase component of U5 snRNP involved in mRNA splicing via spliceosome [Maudiozyma saulgeensis]|uniref:Similar to Saccharomyces cerevisiae YKL173W SNU114 GTPase component of U5 snRNP involved in mRNA splicing via spliceosome n=1 Tax=Maudiozyma saulgeensis TaxID=1789683 RepID=A0A1X7R1F2_9SACH|nr:similar to Saccharomyces cerevisiae YKL173W SNU114 GTPase component of U5 snRNP involved in mRNA splicing via spliceosome [Kazachstania saulgeensis]